MPTIEHIEGPQGKPGIRGPKGDRGERGLMGLEGEKGEKGDPGERGEQGIQGFEGDRGPRGFIGLEGDRGEKGEKGDRGDPGPAGQDGKDADSSEFFYIADQKVEEHEKKFDHSKIDPFLVGSVKIDETNIAKGKLLSFNGQKIVYVEPPKAIQQAPQIGGRGLSLPSQSGNSGKFLTTDGQRASWDTPAGSGGGITRSILSISSDTNAAAVASVDYVYFVSGTTTLTLPTAVGNTNRYSIKNTGSNTVTVAFNGAQTGDGSTTLTLLPNVAVDLVSNNSNFFIL